MNPFEIASNDVPCVSVGHVSSEDNEFGKIKLNCGVWQKWASQASVACSSSLAAATVATVSMAHKSQTELVVVELHCG